MSLLDTPAQPGQPVVAGLRAVVAVRDGRAHALIPSFSTAHDAGRLRGHVEGLAAGDEILVLLDDAGDPWVAGRPREPLQGTVTSLPAGPVDGQEIFYLADATAGVVWHLKYRAASASPYKWEYLGGPPLYSFVATLQTLTSTTYAALATAGPSVSLPLAGDYDVAIGAGMTTAGAAMGAWMSYDIGGTAAVDGDGATAQVVTPGFAWTTTLARRKTALSAVTLTAKYRSSAAVACLWEKRWMQAAPVRVG